MRKSRLLPSIAIILVFLVFVSGCRRTGSWLVKNSVPAHADAMILLMGSYPERVLEAAELFKEGAADKLIIVYESMSAYQMLSSRGVKVVRTTEEARDAAITLGIPADSIIILPGDARSTLDEALVIRNYLIKNPTVETLILVSSPPHMRRASMIFSTAMKKAAIPVYIGTSPSRYSGFDGKNWWKSKEDIQAVVSELVKIGSFVVFESKRLNFSPDSNGN